MNFKKLIGSVVSLCADIAFDDDGKKNSNTSIVHESEIGDESNHTRMMMAGNDVQKMQASSDYLMSDD